MSRHSESVIVKTLPPDALTTKSDDKQYGAAFYIRQSQQCFD